MTAAAVEARPGSVAACEHTAASIATTSQRRWRRPPASEREYTLPVVHELPHALHSP